MEELGEFTDVDFDVPEPGQEPPPHREMRHPQPVKNQSSQKRHKKKKKSSKKDNNEIQSIHVTNPEKREEGMNSFIVYKIITIWVDGTKTEIERRYSQFAWLHEVLGQKIKGVIIPPIPSKNLPNLLGRFRSPDFVEKRRRGLEFFLVECSKHELLNKSDEYYIFLKESTSTLQMTMTTEAEERNWYTVFTELKDHYLAPQSYRDPTEADKKCDEIALYADNLLQIVGNLDSQVQALMKSSREQSQYWFDLGNSMNSLGSFQKQHGFRRIGDALAYLGKHSELTANLLSEKIGVDETRNWSEPINRYKQLVIAIQDMMKGRNDLLQTLKREQGNLLQKETKLRQASGDEHSILSNEIAMSKQRVACLDGQLKEVTERLFQEFDTFKETKAEELKGLLISFGRIQANYHAAMSENWSSVLQCIQNNEYPSDVDETGDMDFVELHNI